jgi:hypothetical protein
VWAFFFSRYFLTAARLPDGRFLEVFFSGVNSNVLAPSGEVGRILVWTWKQVGVRLIINKWVVGVVASMVLCVLEDFIEVAVLGGAAGWVDRYRPPWFSSRPINHD